MRRRCTPHTKEFDRNEGAALFQKYGFSWSYELVLKSRNYPITRINTKVKERRSNHVARELFGDSQAEDMGVGSETNKQRATTHRPDLQTDLAARMGAPVGPQGTNTTAGVEVLIRPTETARYYQCYLPTCADPLKDARCMKYPAFTPNPTPTPIRHDDATATKMPSERTTMNQPCKSAPPDDQDSVIPGTPPDGDDKMPDIRPNLQTKRKVGAASTSSLESQDLLEDDRCTMLFFVPPLPHHG